MLSKKQERIQRKKKKIIALLEVAKLNDKDLAVNKSDKHCEDDDDEQDRTDEKRPRLEGEDYQNLKHMLRERKNVLKKIPRFRLKTVGEQARLSEEDASRTPLFFSDIQHLLVYSVIGNKAAYSPARWCHLERPLKLSHVVVLVIEGLSAIDYKTHPQCFPHLNKIFASSVEIIAPSSYKGNAAAELASLPLPTCHWKMLLSKFKTIEAILEVGDVHKAVRAIFPIKHEEDKRENMEVEMEQQNTTQNLTTDKFSRTELLLSPRQMVQEGYPLPLKGELQGRYMNYKLTKDIYTEVTPNSPMFGLDCEMCLTNSHNHELTRVSVVNEKLEVVYETLVKPQRPIINYMTNVSGITEKMLQDVETRIEDVQTALRKLLPTDAILIGQSLNFDLHALKMMHPYVIDTSISYNLSGDRRLKTKLAVLSHLFLNETIQMNKKGGHNPTEDSIAAMKLIQLKLQNSVCFGDAVMGGYIPFANSSSQVVLKDENTEQKKSDIDSSGFVVSLATPIKDEQRSAAIISDSETLKDYSRFSGGCDTDDITMKISHVEVDEGGKNIAQKIRDISLQHNFTLGHIKLMEGGGEEDEWEDIRDTTIHRSDPERFEQVLSSVDRWCKRVYKHMAVGGLCVIIFTGLREDNPASSGQNGACFIEVKNSVYLRTFRNTFFPVPR